jgi:hypothetical protein
VKGNAVAIEKEDKYPWEVGMTVVSTRSHSESLSVGKIIKLTKTQVIVQFKTHEQKYSRHGGWHKYDAYSFSEIRPITDSDREGIKKRNLCARMTKVEWNTLTMDQLQRINSIVTETNGSST